MGFESLWSRTLKGVLTGRRGRVGRNPRTGEQVVVGPKKVVFFKPGKALQEIIQNAPESRSITEKIP